MMIQDCKINMRIVLINSLLHWNALHGIYQCIESDNSAQNNELLDYKIIDNAEEFVFN